MITERQGGRDAPPRRLSVVVTFAFAAILLFAVAYATNAWAAPSNDDFANAEILSGSTASASGTNLAATKQTGEPNHAGDSGGASVWYRWQAPQSGQVSVDTCDSGFDTLLAVYTGSAVSALSEVSSNDEYCGQQSAVTFNATAGTTYRIAVDGWGGDTGAVELGLKMLLNDNFASAEVLSGTTDSASGTNVGATKETGEPNHAGNLGGASVWYRWQATQDRRVFIDACGSDFDTVLAVYTGSAVNALTEVASNDDDCGQQSAAAFDATAGTTYQIAVDGYDGATGAVGLDLNVDPAAPPNADFDPKQDFVAGDSPVSVAVGDFNGDNKPDLAVANFNSSDVSILRGDGTGSFGAPQDFALANPAAEPSPSSVAVGDFNGDEEQDLAVGHYFQLGAPNDYGSVLLGTGTGSFGNATSLLIQESYWGGWSVPLTAIAVDDFDGDNKDDIAAATSRRILSAGNWFYYGVASVVRGDGTGSFGAPNLELLSRPPRSIAVADFNDDGKQDLVLVTSLTASTSGTASLVYGNGAEDFPAGAGDTSLDLGADGPTSVAVGDFNGDSAKDFVVANVGSDELVTGLNDGSGGFFGGSFALGPTWPNSVAVADFNLDGDEDLAVARAGSNDVAVLRGAGSGSFGSPTRFPVGDLREWGFDGGSLAVGDFNCDGAPDLVSANGDSNNVSVLMNAQGGTTPPGCDTTPPNTTINSGPADGAKISGDSVTFGFSSSEAGSTFECRLQPALPDWKSCESPKGYTLGSSEEKRVFAVRAVDPAGNVDPTPASRSFTVDRTPPDTTITKRPKSKIKTKKKSVKVKVSFTSESGASFQCKLDKAGYKSCTSPYSVKAKSKGGKGKKHTISIQATDEAGNVGKAATVKFTVIRKG